MTKPGFTPRSVWFVAHVLPTPEFLRPWGQVIALRTVVWLMCSSGASQFQSSSKGHCACLPARHLPFVLPSTLAPSFFKDMGVSCCLGPSMRGKATWEVIYTSVFL